MYKTVPKTHNPPPPGSFLEFKVRKAVQKIATLPKMATKKKPR